MSDPDLDIPEFKYKNRRGRQPVDPAMRRIAFGAGGISVLIIVVALGWSGIKPHLSFGPPPVVQAPPGPLRVAPADPGGLTVPGAEVPIMSGQSSDSAPELAPAGPGPAIAQLNQAAGGGQAAAPASAPAAAPISPPVAAPPSAPPAPASGPTEVQLAATPDQAGVKKAWSQLEVKMPDVLKGHQPIFIPAVVNGQNIWRLRVRGFADVTAARQFCAAVIAKGGACTVAAF